MAITPVIKKARLTADQVAKILRDREQLTRETRRVADAFQNVLARTGYGTPNLLQATAYPLTRLTYNYILLQSLYRNDWIVRKVVDYIAEDMVKNWITIVSEISPGQIESIDRAVDETATADKLIQAMKWGRLFGGAGAIIVLAGQEDQLDQPLDVENVELGSYKGLLVFDRWSGIRPSAKINNDVNDPINFGLPESYQVVTETAQSFHVHSSRVLRFIGPDVPSWEKQAEQRWGISEIEVMYDELNKRNNTSWNIASLIFRANILELKHKDLAQLLSGVGTNATAAARFAQVLQAQNELMSNQGLFVSDSESGGLAQHSYSFGGIADVYINFMMDICGATGYPMSRLFGRTVTGLATTNEGDEHTYYDLIGQKQKRELNPQLRKLLPIVAMSTWGAVPDDFDWQFNPVRSLSNEEQAELVQKGTQPVIETFNAGIIGRKTALSELRELSEQTSAFSNITAEMIAEADDTPMSEMSGLGGVGEPGGELMPEGAGPGGLPSEEALGKATDVVGAAKRKAVGDATEKLSHAVVQYETTAKNPKTICARCAYYVPAEHGKPACEKVVSPIHFNGWCTEFTTSMVTDVISYQNIPIFIENRVGSVRRGRTQGDYGHESVKEYAVRMTYPYGYILDSEGVDGDHVDCFVGSDAYATYAYVVHALNPGTGHYDEDKVMLGFSTAASAYRAFMENYSDGEKFFGGMDKIPMARFVEQLRDRRGKRITADES